MCETVKVNYHLIFIRLTSDSRALSVILASTYSEEWVFVTSCDVFAFKLRFLDWPMNNISMRYRAIQLCIYYIYSIRWSSRTSASSAWRGGEKVSRTLDPFGEVYIKPERMRRSKGQVMTVPAGPFHLSLRDGWATGDQSAPLRHAVVRCNLSIHILTAPEEASAVDHNHNQSRLLLFACCISSLLRPLNFLHELKAHVF